ncbi:MAG: TIGR03084 family metal-binding protein [Microthrixaceae bacterium]
MSPDPFDALRADLADEVAALAAVVDPLDAAGLRTPTPAEGWDVADTLAHLAAFDGHGTLAITDPEAFRSAVVPVLEGTVDPIAEATDRGRALGPVGCRDWWHRDAAALAAAAAGLDRSARLPWYGPDMGAMSFVTARLMETWAHGQDVRDALGVPPEVSARLRHVADIGVRARPYSYGVRGLELPAAPVRVELVAPDGSTWAWGEDTAPDRIAGPAVDFCLLVTQRRHRDDLDLEVVGPVAAEWAGIAQAFAGGAGAGRAPLQP